MFNNYRNLRSLLQSHGGHWLMFRLGYALRKRTGLIRAQMPAYQWEDRPLETWLKGGVPAKPEDYAVWRKQNSPGFFRAERSGATRHEVEAQLPGEIYWNPQIAVEEAERILNGELNYFSHIFVKTGFPPDWHNVPTSLLPPSPVGRMSLELENEPTKHWSEISDDGDVDIKFIWEASRFSMVYPLVRAYESMMDEKYADAFWTLLESWAESNPPNTGPNWMDGQEAALRILAWMFGFYAFIDSPSTTPQRIVQLTGMVAAHAERIYKNINYAISTHSNHAISEAFGLWLVGLLFPEWKDAETYLRLGRQILEQEAAEQIFPDGTYSMYSLNYHRFVLHIYLLVLRVAQLNQSPTSSLISDRVSASIDFLSQLIDPETGQMPVYGSNDGALVLPLNNCDFMDYRPLLQLGSYITNKMLLFEPGPWDEDIFWFFGEESPSPVGRRVRDEGELSFPHGGIYLLHGTNSKAIIRCTDFHTRPSHADQLHVDLWWRGINIACDAGTYLYSGEGIWRNGLAHTWVHNTVAVDRQDQMKMLTRFTWTNWARGKVIRQEENVWQGEHDGYKRLADPVSHRRTVITLGEDRWLVVDHLDGKLSHHYALQWLLSDFPYEQRGNSILLSIDSEKCKVQVGLVDGDSTFSIVRADPNSTRGWRSQYYADREPAISLMLETDQPRSCFWTFFGFEDDSTEWMGNELKIRFDGREISIDLAELYKS